MNWSTRDFAHSQASIAAVIQNMKRSEFDRIMVIYFNRIIRQWKGPMSKRMRRYIKRERHLRNEQKRAMKRGLYATQ